MPSRLLASRLGGRLWVALIEDGELCELEFDRPRNAVRQEQIYKARVTHVAPAMQSAFLDLGGDGGAFLHATELVLPGEAPLAASRPGRRPPIEQRLKAGRDLVVQVIREAHGTKGPRVSCVLSFPGRRLVFAPDADRCAVSGRVHDGAERERLLHALRTMEPGTGGFIARTAAVGATAETLSAEAAGLIQRWQIARERAAERGTPGLIQREPDLLERRLRDAPVTELEAVIFDDPADRARAQDYLNAVEPAPPTRLRLHCGAASLFERHAVFAAVDRALRPDVRLPTGGRLVIEETEALISIDVDSGQHASATEPERAALQVNLQAAREFPRQLRLRGLAGTVVVDLIRMNEESSRRQVVREVERSAAGDRGRLRVAELGELGLLQLTRRRAGPSLAESVTDPCPCCRAPGRIKNARLVAAEVIEALRRQTRNSPQSAAFHVRAGAGVLAELEECSARTELWPGAGRLTLSYEALNAEGPPDRFEIRRR